jgi:uncharacterized protein (DUF2345 family)
MTAQERTKGKLPHNGPYLAEITNHLDTTYMGELEVAIIKGLPADFYSQNETYNVSYLSPFYGVTSLRFEGNNSSNFNDVQKSYGMWMIPPDVGTKVLVIFIEGDPNQGYWIGCVQDAFQNHMVPGIPASLNSAVTKDQERIYGTSMLPVAEIHKGNKDNLNLGPVVGKLQKAVHPFADRLLAQGLLLDTVRGVTSSGARREVPSQVFGISTPGPLDTSSNARRAMIGYAKKRSVPVSRLGGTTFVMDDGDVNGQNELVRLRTRTGHQILLHNTQDLIYIANSRGTAWIEMTSNGKIDIYAQDSVSIHTENDFNFRADRDINLEAGRNLNLKVANNAEINVGQNTNLISVNGKLLFTGDYEHTVNSELKISAHESINLKATSIYQTASGELGLTGGTNKITSKGDTNILSGGNHYETAGEIHMNGPSATAAVEAGSATTPSPLRTYSLPNRSKESGWIDGNLYKADPISSIMQRVPTHEPWDQHENVDPVKFSPTNTDVSAGLRGGDNASNVPWPEPNGSQPADWAKDRSFLLKVKEVAKSINCDYVDLLACMSFETGRTFNPNLRNSIGATGLIQFIPSTAKGLGTTTDYLAGLTRTDQMAWVEKYFKAGPLGKLGSAGIDDLYMAILWPAAVGKPSGYRLFEAGTKAYTQNPLDIGNKGYVSKEDAATKVRAQLAYVKQQIVNAQKAGIID